MSLCIFNGIGMFGLFAFLASFLAFWHFFWAIWNLLHFLHFGIIILKSRHHGRAKLARQLWSVIMLSFDLKMSKCKIAKMPKKRPKPEND